jgi:hypothetical protein
MSHKLITGELEATDLDLIILTLTKVMGFRTEAVSVGPGQKVTGYQGKTYSDSADIVIKKQDAGCHYGDIGFEKAKSGKFRIIGDDLDLRRLNFENNFKLGYFEANIRRQMADNIQGQRAEITNKQVNGTKIKMRIEVPA